MTLASSIHSVFATCCHYDDYVTPPRSQRVRHAAAAVVVFIKQHLRRVGIGAVDVRAASGATVGVSVGVDLSREASDRLVVAVTLPRLVVRAVGEARDPLQAAARALKHTALWVHTSAETHGIVGTHESAETHGNVGTREG